MGVFEEGRTDCVKELLKPAERVLKEGLDIGVESFSRRERLWLQIEENYDRYLDGECGEFLKDLDMHFRGKFEGALAILAWSFRQNGETYLPASRRYRDRELEALERVLRYNVFEIYSKEDIMKKIMHRDNNVLGLLREYYHGVDRWIDDALNDPSIKLPLRGFLKTKWDSYKSKINAAIAEATMRFDWFRDFLTMAGEETQAVERTYQRRLEAKEREMEELRRQMEDMRRNFEREKEELRRRLETAKEAEISRLIQEKEEMRRQFEEERQRLIEEISRMKDEEARRTLEAELDRMQREMMASIEAMEAEIRRKELELKEKEMELRKRELELKEKEDEVTRRIKEVMSLAGKVEKGSRFVRLDEARMLEMNFVGRIRSKFRDEVKLLGRTFKVESVEERKTFDKSAYAGKLSERDLKNVPDNRLVEVRLKEKKLLGKKEEITVKALFYGRSERYAEVGFDTDPLELADINALLVDARDEAKNGRIVLLVASPTGFERRIANYVNSGDFHRNFISENVSLALLDLESGELIYNPHDEYARAFEPMLRLERDEELLAKVKDFLEEKIIMRGYVRLEEALEHFAEEVVKRAFHELSKEKGYITKFVEGVGYVLVKEGFL
ncbi:hypothetical protein CL1_1731 [Thermococcus cleftensis]|uniref:Uncharacterized protein n=1 Tax=Thermococcus cleftensis (strain DSM 27260 / KACC 17922 / CL1) TaxID=163003 RepID=I3ZW44_THECF|nr:hypothetical protein [Thermococcus cleftensis]AFL95928.1 hypothetical protein CL1_1731 [Thermococcus cleftensis]